MPRTSQTSPAAKVDPYQAVTDRVIAMIESGEAEGSWTMSWHGLAAQGMPCNAANGVRYRGINIVLLADAAQRKAYNARHWATYLQWQQLGAQVRKGEKATQIVKVGLYIPRDMKDDDSIPEAKKRRTFLKFYSVFNADQVDGWQAPAEPVKPRGEAELLAEAEAYVSATGATIKHGGGRAFYTTGSDHIQMPPREDFRATENGGTATENYYSTLLHELTHWTGHETRCNREFGRRFGDEAYAFEELVAELGAAFQCGALAITPEFRADHARYIGSWLKVLKRDKRAIIEAAAKASVAADYLAAFSGEDDAAEPAEQPEPAPAPAQPEPAAPAPPAPEQAKNGFSRAMLNVNGVRVKPSWAWSKGYRSHARAHLVALGHRGPVRQVIHGSAWNGQRIETPQQQAAAEYVAWYAARHGLATETAAERAAVLDRIQAEQAEPAELQLAAE